MSPEMLQSFLDGVICMVEQKMRDQKPTEPAKKPEAANEAGTDDDSGPPVANCPCTRCTARRHAAVKDLPTREREDLQNGLGRIFCYLSRFKNEEAQAELGFIPKGRALSGTERLAVLEFIQNLNTAIKSIQQALGSLAAFEALQSSSFDGR